MNKTRILQLLAFFLTGALLFAACGGDDGGNAFVSDTAGTDDGGSDESTAVAASRASAGDDGDAFIFDQPEEEAVDDEEAMEEDEEAMEEDAMADGDATTESPAPTLGTGGSGNGSAPGALQPLDIGRDIIFTARISVQVDSVGDAAKKAMTEIEALGGLLFGQETSTDGVNRTVLTFRVRPGDFQEAVSRLGGIGELRDQSISSEDVTARVTDLRSQIITAEASVERLREFLKGATGLEEVARLEAQLLDRETTLERLRGQLRVVQERVDLATITVVLTQKVPGPNLVLTQTLYKDLDKGISCQGEQNITIDAQDAFTVCFRIDNAGDTHLSDITVIEENLDITGLNLVVTEGKLSESLAPGERIVGYFETADTQTNTEIVLRVSAKVVNEAGEDLGVARVGDRGNGFVSVRTTNALPGFSDSLDKGLDVLAKLIGVVVILIGLFLPFIWVPIVAWLAFRLLRSRAQAHRDAQDQARSQQTQVVSEDTDVTV